MKINVEDPDRSVLVHAFAKQATPTDEVSYTSYARAVVERGSSGFTVLAASDPAAPVTEVDLGALLGGLPTGFQTIDGCENPFAKDGTWTGIEGMPKCNPVPSPVLIDGLTLEQCRERWEANAAAIESGMATPYALSPDQIAEGKRLHLEARKVGR